ncbi:MAG: MBL fold metallo-hydrolase [Verrucomicrobiota bacterium]
MLEFCVLGSGSAGNSSLVRSGKTTILIDAGLSAKQLVIRMQEVGVNPDHLDGIVLTHEHGDHTRGIDVLCRKRKLAVYCNIRTREVLRPKVESEVSWRLFESGDAFPVGDIRIQSFYIPHDAVEPMGFVFVNGAGRLGLLSDIGHVTTLVKDHLSGVDTLFVEANYDDLMLQNDTKRPWSTKQRISSRHGHLSNAQAAELVSDIESETLHRVVLGHLSRDCNAPDVAIGAIRKTLEEQNRADICVECAGQNEVIPFQPVRKGGMSVPVKVAEEKEPVRPRVPAAPMSPWQASQQSLFEI